MSEPEYVRKYKFYEKVFQAKVIELKKIYLDGVAKVRSRSHPFFKMTHVVFDSKI